MSPADRSLAAGTGSRSLASVYERRTGPRNAPSNLHRPRIALGPDAPRIKSAAVRDRLPAQSGQRAPLPAKDEDIASRPSRTCSLDRIAPDHLRTPHQHLSCKNRNASIRSCAASSPSHATSALSQAKQADRKSPPASTAVAARHPVGRQRSARHRGIPTTYAPSHTATVCPRRMPPREAPARCRGRVDRQTQHGALALNDICSGARP